MTRMKFMNTEIDNLTRDEALAQIDKLIQEDKNAYIVTPNVDHILQLEAKGELLRAYEGASLILTDGHPLIWISRLYGTPIKEKIAGSDLFPSLCELAAERGYTMFFLGAPEGVAAKAAKNLQERLPGLQVVGTYSPPYGFENDEAEIRKIIDMIKSVRPHILIVALGCPKQELFIYHYAEELHVPLSLGLGATLNFAAGTVKRAPKWMTNHGLEWLYRATQERRLIKRYAMNLLRLPWLIIKYWPRKSS